ncbi:MAG: methylmalonyl-CoA epimerase [bacterium]|nr:methylmalonyl-CoA epimerase [bacterium]
MSNVRSVDHIGVAVGDLEAAIRTYRALGLEGGEIEELPDQGLRLAFFKVGESRVELLASTDPASAIGRFLASRGEGIHHLALRVPDAAAALARAVDAGLRAIDQRPRAGAGGARVAFLHPKGLHGVLVEFVERAEGEGH